MRLDRTQVRVQPGQTRWYPCFHGPVPSYLPIRKKKKGYLAPNSYQKFPLVHHADNPNVLDVGKLQMLGVRIKDLDLQIKLRFPMSRLLL